MNEPKPTRWHDLTDAQWLALFEAANVRAEITRTLYQIASCKKAKTQTRLAAIQVMSRAIHLGLVADDTGIFPTLMRDTLMSVVRGERPGNQKLREEYEDRLVAVDTLINTVAQFMPRNAPASTEQKAEKLLS